MGTDGRYDFIIWGIIAYMDLISIIVPVYQVEQYITECIESIINQSYRNIEVILIDDGSLDQSGKICDFYAQKDPRIMVIHQDNKGLSGARNVGLNAAKGQYICFVDSDDYIKQDFVETLYRMIQENKADIAVCDYIRKKGWKKSCEGDKKGYTISSKKMLSEWHCKRSRIETVVWNKMYRKDVFGKDDTIIRFPEGKIHEDVYISHLLVANAGLVAVTHEPLYYYRKNKDSITNKKRRAQVRKQNLEAQKIRMLYFKSHHYIRTYLRLKILYCVYSIID